MRRSALILILLASNAGAAELFGSDVKLFVGGDYVTNDQEAVQVGVTLQWDKVDVDFSHGVKKMRWYVPSEPQWKMDEWQSGSLVSIRVYPFGGKTIRPMITWWHSSDITRGLPFNDKSEPTSDFVGLGVTAIFKNFQLDVAYGSLARECALFECAAGARTNEVAFALRGYF